MSNLAGIWGLEYSLSQGLPITIIFHTDGTVAFESVNGTQYGGYVEFAPNEILFSITGTNELGSVNFSQCGHSNGLEMNGHFVISNTGSELPRTGTWKAFKLITPPPVTEKSGALELSDFLK